MAGSDGSSVGVLTVDLAPGFCLECPNPLNSWKLTISVMKAITQALNLLSTGTKEETVMIEGKLTEGVLREGGSTPEYQIHLTWS